MEMYATTVYVINDEVLRILNLKDDNQSRMSNAEIITFLAVKSSDTCYFAVDSFPVTYCQKNRIDKRKRFLDRKYIGFAASKKRYFCDIKVHEPISLKFFNHIWHLFPQGREIEPCL